MVTHCEGSGAWLALASSSLMYMLMAIPDGTYAILYDHLIDAFDASRTNLGWALSMYWISIYLAGLLFSPLVDLYGCRTLAFISAGLFASGMALSSISYTLPGFYATYGLLGGLGCGGLFLACSTIIQQRFTYNRGFATGISSLGFSIGAVIHPMHTLYFLQTFGLRGTLLTHAGLTLHTSVFSFALKSPKSYRERTKSAHALNKSPSKQDTENDDDHELHALKTPLTKISSNGEVYHIKNENTTGTHDCRNNDDPDCTYVGSGSVVHVGTDVRFPDSSAETKQSNSTRLDNCFGRFSACKDTTNEYFKKMLDFSLLRKLSFVLAVSHFFLLWMARLSIMAQLVSCAIYRGIAEDNAAYLISISGFGNIVLRVIAAVLMNFKWLNPILFSGTASLIVMSSGLMAAYSTNYLMFSITAALMGISEAIAFSILPLLVVSVVGVSRFPRGIALLNTLMLPAPLGAAPFSGWLVDKTGDYVWAFLVTGCEGAISTALAVVLFFLLRSRQSRKPPEA